MSRHAIVCPAHVAGAGLRGDDRVCPVGGHRLTRWWVVDARRAIVLEEVSIESGIEREINQPLSSVPRLTVQDVSLTKKEKSMPRGVPGSGPYGDPSKAPQQPKVKAARGKVCLLSTKFSAGSKILWLRLVRSHSSDDATRYRVRWELLDAKDAKGASEIGVVAAFSSESDARVEYELSLSKAAGDGWAAATTGHLVLKPIPAPPAGAKGRKAA